jgi:glycerol-3-phosphate dehydrogenase (NAD(P)+)
MVLADAGSSVRMWGRREEACRHITEKHENVDYLPGLVLPESIAASTDTAWALEGADIVVLAVPSQSLREILAAASDLIPADALLVSLMKGVELGTHMRMSEVIAEVAGAGPERIAVVSGPNLAREIAAKQPTATVVACADQDGAEKLADACSAPYFRPYTNTDVVGVELGGAVKNVIALAVGIAEGMGFGDNTQASLITRGLAETARLGAALGAQHATFAGLAGLGDLVATCASPLSRNRTFGVNLGKGMTVDEVVAVTKQTAEGVKSCRSIVDLARSCGVDMPLAEHVVKVVHEGMPAADMARSLLDRPRKHETA